MKTVKKTLCTLIVLMSVSCVQKAYKRTVVFELDTKGITNVKKVGIRGENSPLSWDKDYLMVLDVKDSLYKATITEETGYLFEQFKFVVNDEFELKEQDNRKIYFENKDTVVYKAVFNEHQ